MSKTIGFRLVAAILSGIAAMGVAGCSTTGTNAQCEVKIDRADDPGVGPLGVDVQNQLGEVEVTVDPAVEHPFVEAVPMATGSPMGSIDRESGASPWAAAQIGTSEGGRVLRVLCTSREGESARPVYLRVVVPACDGVRVRNSGGPATVVDVGGTIDVQTTPSAAYSWPEGGAVRVRTSRVLKSNVTLVSSDGEVSLDLPRSSTGTIVAESPNTRVDLATVKGTQSNSEARTSLRGVYSVSLNEGTNTLTLRSGRGVRLTTEVERVPWPPTGGAKGAPGAAAADATH